MTATNSAPPRSIAELAATSQAWKIDLGDFGRWLTAERLVRVDGQQWRIGLTPVNSKVVALVLWREETVVEHLRGSEAEMCARAHRWAASVHERSLGAFRSAQ
ncbi:hypothetical protein AB0M48_35630 [Lentzea sp. NPDC051208]|uniref:hypothetical protein n=1 Tax=Lentzea sp. NPDC051208 TaxID=3154642 RepID=UPI0034394646